LRIRIRIIFGSWNRILKSWIRIRASNGVKIQELFRLKMEPWSGGVWTLAMKAWRLKMKPWRVCRPVVADADSHHLNEEQDPDPH
jgi:hypothetical protein